MADCGLRMDGRFRQAVNENGTVNASKGKKAKAMILFDVVLASPGPVGAKRRCQKISPLPDHLMVSSSVSCVWRACL
jgi:hypothetical protein